jgi:Short repeat of unknown function (DUF308)
MLAKILSRYWWMTLVRGAIWILFGIVIFTQPLISLVALTLTFGAFAFVDGVANAVSAIGGRRENETWWVLLLAGLCGIGVGLLTFFSPDSPLCSSPSPPGRLPPDSLRSWPRSDCSRRSRANSGWLSPASSRSRSACCLWPGRAQERFRSSG